MERILFLDFDGVLFDTVDEAYQVCINTQTFRNCIFPNNSLELFRTYRTLVGPAWNYYYVMKAIIDNLSLENTTSFIEKKETKEFEQDFFLTRKELKKDYINWLQYNKKYSFINRLEDISLKKDYFIYIITTKDKQTVEDLLKEHNIGFIKSEYILGKDSFNSFGSKREIILNVLKNKTYKALFIDDLYSHLKLCEGIEDLTLVQADWGYVDSNNRSQYLKNEDETLEMIQKL